MNKQQKAAFRNPCFYPEETMRRLFDGWRDGNKSTRITANVGLE